MKINEKNLCVFATSPPYDYEGFLSKRGEVNKAFQRRYFVLKGNLLFYFEKKGDKEPLGLIIVEGCTIELSEESDQYCFEIAFNGNRTYILSADSQESMESWMKALTCAGYEYKKLMVAELQRQLEEIEGSRNKMLGDVESHVSSIPKPPPRRQNPFNRPAPPLPAVNGNSGEWGGSANVSFINGQFGSTSQRTGSHTNPEIRSNPVAPPRIGARSEFYVPQQTQDIETSAKNAKFEAKSKVTPATTITKTTAVFATADDLQNHNDAIFEQLHEKFRHLVMKDVWAYQAQRELKSRPLIDL